MVVLRRRLSFEPSLLAFLLLIHSGLLFGQAAGTTTGDIRGSIQDASGALVRGALVTAVNVESGLARSDTSSQEGAFEIRFLAPGLYRVTAESGSGIAAIENVRVLLGSSVRLDVRLEAAAVAETVMVSAAARLIDPTSTQLSETIDERKIRDLPINQRNFLDFALTTPGVTLDRGPQTGAASTSGLSINGQSPRSNNVLVDGLDNNDPAVGSVRSTFSQEAVEEYQVIRSGYSAEQGRATGGIVNIVTRSGSNELHGSAFWFFRDDSLATDHGLTGTKTPFEQHQFGASLGGPVLHDRVFFFGAAERLDVSDTNVVTISDESVAAIRRAGFEVENGEQPFGRERTATIAKLDWLPRPSHTVTLRGTWAKEEDENQHAWGGLVAKSGGGVRSIEDHGVAATGISILSPSFSNEARLLYAGRDQRLESLDPGEGVGVAIQGVATFGTDPILPQPREMQIWQLFDAVSLFLGESSYKAGVDYLRAQVEGRLPLYFAGSYQFGALPGFTALEAFEAGIPVAFVQGFGDPDLADGSSQFAAFVQGEWPLSAGFFLRLGIRYELEDPIAPFPRDANNWAPRLSFSWAGNPTWRVRGGAGRFYGPAPMAPGSLVAIENGERARTIVRTILGGPSPAQPWRLSGRRFARETDAGLSVVPLTVYRSGDFESGYSDQASLGLEKELGTKGLLFHVDYLHVRGRNVLIERNVNPILSEDGGRPDPAFSEIFLYESAGNTWYDAVTTGVRTAVGRPLTLAAQYTWADAEDDHIDWARSQPQDPLDISSERGPTVHVPRHQIVLSGVWSAGSRAESWWRRDWTVALIGVYSSGLPYNELAGFDRNANGDAFSDRPEGVRRNGRSLPDFFNVDLRIARGSRLRRGSIEVLVEAFNLFNRENVLEVNNVRYSSADLDPNPSFGDPTRLADPRRIQLGVRYSF